MNLEGNKLSDTALKPLLNALSSNNTIKKLNLSKNYLTNNNTEAIGKMLENNTAIDELYLKWNQINGTGGSTIFKGLIAGNSKIKVLDMSWNSFGLYSSSFSKTFAEFIISNDSLLHLDLSHNKLGKEDSKIISDALAQNHSLYGMHYDGNYGYMDPNGYLKLINVPDQKYDVNYVTHQINGNYFLICKNIILILRTFL